MLDWKAILKNLYCPEVGTLWAVPNRDWDNGFAANKDPLDYHPAIVEWVSACKTIIQIVPGTSKDYRVDHCVFPIKLTPASPKTYFLIDLSMAYPKDELLKLRQGWDNTDRISDEKISAFNDQIKFCKGAHV